MIGRAPGGPVRIEAGKPRPLPQSALAFLRDPDRRVANGLVLGLAALGAAWTFDEADGFAGACLAAWLGLLALPAGALPVVIMIERSDAWRPQPETALLETLRWLLSLMPVAILLLVPVLTLADAAELYPWLRGARPDTPLAAIWFKRGFLTLRLVGYATAWIVLARLFARRSGGPSAKAGRIDDGRAVLGLGLHIFVGTLAVTDLIGALDPQARSALSGLVVMAGWSSFALAASIVAAPPDIGPSRRRLDRLTPLAVLLAIWAALHLVSYAMLTSPGHPQEAAWYAVRAGSYGRALAIYGGLVVALAALLTLKPGENRTRLVGISALVLHGLETFWLVTPSLRGSFAITSTDSLALAGILALAFGLHPLSRRILPEPDGAKRRKPS